MTRTRRRLCFIGIYLLFVVVVAWLGVRFFWWYRFGAPVLGAPDRDAILRNAYPELWTSGILAGPDRPIEGRFNILLLGASVLQQCTGEFAREADRRSPPWKTYGVAVSAHTSRDSWFKYQRVKDLPFQAVLYYDCINEARMNCCPPGNFRLDYRHCQWYDSLERRLAKGTLTLTDVVWDRLPGKISHGKPKTYLVDEGAELKTPSAFRANLESIIQDASTRRRSVVVITFACYLAEGYTDERYLNHELDYGSGPFQMAARIWGKPENVLAAVTAHNAELRSLAAQYPENVVLIDLEKEFPRDGVHFSDPCHLTDAGVAKWSEIVWRELRKKFGDGPPRMEE